jgi:beta-glucuronidase
VIRPTLLVLAVAVAIAAGAAVAQAQGGGSGGPAQTTPTTPPPPPPPPPALQVEPPTGRTYVREGQRGRYLLGGTWYFRQDDTFVGIAARWFRQRSLNGWRRISVPHNWNATDLTQNRSSVGWYRREFTVPRTPRGKRFRWKARFESANHRAIVYLNGRQLGTHVGGYFPFEVDLNGLRRGRNTLVIRISTLRAATDLTHRLPAKFNGYGTGGWWNAGGLLREVYLRRIEGADVEGVEVLPRLNCVRCGARVRVRVRVRNMDDSKRGISLAMVLRPANFRGAAQRWNVGEHFAEAGARRTIETSAIVRRPRLWQPGRPRLYVLEAVAKLRGRPVARYKAFFGIKRLVRTRTGELLLNGRRLQVRGASIHEDDPLRGAASTPGQRRMTVLRLKQVGATVSRSHYPVHPALMEALDREGIMFWAQAPVYQVADEFLGRPSVRRAAVRFVEETVRNNVNHPSVFVWSVANELRGDQGPNESNPQEAAFISQAAAAARAIDPERMVGIDRRSALGQFDPAPVLRELDIIGANVYFGWYHASSIGRASKVEDLGPFLDRLHSLYPGKALMVTEFGAEGNRDGPVDRKGTFAFQTAWMKAIQAAIDAKPFVSGSIAWILRDFRVHPTWGGGNPTPNPPWNNKGLIEEGGGLKAVFFDMQRIWKATRPLR